MDKFATIRHKAFAGELEKLGVSGLVARLLTKQLPRLLTILRAAPGSLRAESAQFLSRAGKEGLNLSQIYRRGIAGAARKWGHQIPEVTWAKTIKTAPKARWGLFGRQVGKERMAVARATTSPFATVRLTKSPLKWLATRPRAWAGEAASNLHYINTKGIRKYITNQ
jgi:hypothetical protein